MPSAFPEVPGIYPNEHKRAIEKHFAVAATEHRFDGGALKCVYLICFTNRCGSNFVAQAIASGRSLRQAGENLNWDAVVNWSSRLNLASFHEYFSWLTKAQASADGVFGCKVSIGQLMFLQEYGILHELGDKLKVIHVRREDVLDQAISLFIASKTNRWTSDQQGKEVEIQADPDTILRIANSLVQQNSTFEVVFRLLGLTPLRIDYDAFVRDPGAGLSAIGHFIGVPTLRLNEANLTYKKQADERNAGIKKVVLEHYRVVGR